MKILLGGGTGFIGQSLVRNLTNCEFTLISRNPSKGITWEQLQSNGTGFIQQFDAVINLAGASVGDKRWSDARKKEILSSRINTTQIIAKILSPLGHSAPHWYNASAIGIYGLQKTRANELPPAMDENTPIDFAKKPDFLAEVGRAWEIAAKPAIDSGVPVTFLRFGVVLGKNGGALSKMLMPFKFGLGGPVGSGQQAMSWVSLEDVCAAVQFLLNNKNIIGPVNIVSPQCVPQKQFANTIGKVLKKPSIVPTPEFILKLIFGQMAEELLLNGSHVYPKILLTNQYEFKNLSLQSALEKIL